MRLLNLSGVCVLSSAFLTAALPPTMANGQTKADCAWMYGIDGTNFLTDARQNPSNAVFASENYYFIKWKVPSTSKVL
jgi:hypothetical protein